jgi:hypothetical protein
MVRADCLMCAMVTVLALGSCSVRRANRVTVRNSTAEVMTEIQLDLHKHGAGGASVSKRVPSLSPGESLVVEHPMLDLSVQLSYRIGDTPYEHSEAYVDLWAGEGWLLDVRADGTVQSKHDYAGSDQGARPSQ